MSIEVRRIGELGQKNTDTGGCIGIVINCDLILSYSYYS